MILRITRRLDEACPRKSSAVFPKTPPVQLPVHKHDSDTSESFHELVNSAGPALLMKLVYILGRDGVQQPLFFPFL